MVLQRRGENPHRIKLLTIQSDIFGMQMNEAPPKAWR